MTSALKDATQRVIAAIEAFSRQCEAIHYTDTDAAWTLLNTARASLETALLADGSPYFPAFLLDPAAATIRTVLLNKAYLLASLYRLTGCSSVDRLWFNDQHVVYFDNEGMLGLVTGLFTIRDRTASPAAGCAIIVRDDGEGGNTSPTVHRSGCRAISNLSARYHARTGFARSCLVR